MADGTRARPAGPRHFRLATGMSFKQWLLEQRLAHARGLLEAGNASVELVAQQAGFGSALSLRQHFKAALQTSPAAYRKLFRTSSPATRGPGALVLE